MSLFSRYSEANVKKFTNKKLYERLTRLNNETKPKLKKLKPK